MHRTAPLLDRRTTAPAWPLTVVAALLLVAACSRAEQESRNDCEVDGDCESGLCVGGICAPALAAVDASSGNDALGEDLGLTDRPDAEQPPEDVRDDGRTDDAGRDADDTGDDAPVDTGDDTADDTSDDAPADTADDTGEDAADDTSEDAPDDSGEDAPRNACGGTAVLDGEPGDACGPCDLDILVCDGPNELVCGGATAANECGGCTVLEAGPGAGCGPCGGGELVCDGSDATRCEGGDGANACGGCAALDGTPGERCGRCSSGTWVCDGETEVRCDGDLGDDAANPCTGCAELDANPGDACGTCDAGELECGGPNLLVCDDPGDAARNRCGGCAELAGDPGDACGACGRGELVCDGDDALACQGGDAGVNACGGCDDLPAEPGDACDDCGGVWVCTDAGGMRCRAGDVNACGGCGGLRGTPGDFCVTTACGFAGGVWVCTDVDEVDCLCEPPPESCGDGVLDLDEGERCDDGNRLPDDGCDALCEPETVIAAANRCDRPGLLARNALVTLDLCAADDSTDNVETDACTSDGTAGDVVLRFDLPERSRVFVEVRDADGVAIDPLVYLRSDCTDPDSQLACGDDVPCDEADITGDCVGDFQPRVGRLEVDLAAGRYSLWVDHFAYRSGSTTFTCGDVDLLITSTPLGD